MAVFPLIFDVTPRYFGASPCGRSLLLAPLGSGSVLCHVHARLTELAPYKLTVVATFPIDDTYREAIERACGQVERVITQDQFAKFVAGLEPSDSLLLIDPTCLAAGGLDATPLFDVVRETPGKAAHLTALDANSGGTCEWAEVDPQGQLIRIQRYYDDLTWSYAVGVAASLVPVWCLSTTRTTRITSLFALRSSLASAGIPSHDVPLKERTFDLSYESEFLALTSHVVRDAERGAPASAAGMQTVVDASARLVGSVVLHAGARIGKNAVVVGPAVIGAGASIGAGATVVQCVVNNGVDVPAGAVARHQLVGDEVADARDTLGPPAYDPLAIHEFRSDLRDETPSPRAYLFVKLVVESAIATLAFILLLPLMLLVGVLIKLESRGPVLYVDRRESRGGKTFACLKFRTMRTGADLMQRQLRDQNDVDGPQFKLEKDPRVTGMGRWIRPCSIDELPQLLNVMFGQMSLVGPRPSPFRENQTCVPWREGRLSVRPGITGLWQVCRHDRNEGDFYQWIHFDLLYVQHMSPLVDIKIVLATIATLGGKLCVPLNWIIPAWKPAPKY